METEDVGAERRISQVFMVEVFRTAGERPRIQGGARDGAVLCAIDIPTDELTLYLVVAPDAADAEALLQRRGVRTLRATAVDVHRGRAAGPSVRESPDVGGTDLSQRVHQAGSPPVGGDGASE